MWFEAGLQLSNLRELILLPSERNKDNTFFSTLQRVILKYRKERGLKLWVNGNWEAVVGDH
ncbi:hypothetical protein AGABI2DRAFT_183587 [Agaricus bisporus var. bisporus H97]|uniref:hypothetical protein n=1 Tax=Agaricus bisporus var. bisporus (strain H97 / ATCC MYA-4626 / FGSC 10389) TaxID=936046 RepID=UPI00029F57DF|nr:hypothetical protein AGABI2DRAFT_183587 [Agaricus bisporus var. bisporus H97]EKV50520.1 hypothetical protein AGABI2DRAFT_183587 [Agaricus bisporus var. bisporus H97]